MEGVRSVECTVERRRGGVSGFRRRSSLEGLAERHLERRHHAGAVTDRPALAHRRDQVAVRALIDQARRRDLRITALDVRTSGDVTGEHARVVGYGTYAFEYAHSARLPDDARERLLEAARAGLSERLPAPGDPNAPVAGSAAGVAAVPAAVAALAEDVCVNARKAAYADPRFRPLEPDEIDRLQVSVSVLSHPRAIPADSEAQRIEQLRPDMDVLILADGDRSALFLPSVWRSLPDPRRFVRELRRKARLPEEGWTPTMRASLLYQTRYSNHEVCGMYLSIGVLTASFAMPRGKSLSDTKSGRTSWRFRGHPVRD
jgi:AmmeMemoRadiSam system protein A